MVDENSESVVVQLNPDRPTFDEAPEDFRQQMRVVEALLFASAEPVSIQALQARVPEQFNVKEILQALRDTYAGRGVNLIPVAGKWAFRTADDLSFLLQTEAIEQRKLSRAALETLSIIAYHQPVTRAEIEDVRGVATNKGTLDVLMETGWIRMRGRRKTPGRPVTYGTTEAFLDHFVLESVSDLPGIEELKGAGLLDSQMPMNFPMPKPSDNEDLTDDEDPLEDELQLMADLIAEEEEE